MRSRSAIWFECKIRFEKVMDDGLQKKVNESYVVDALSFSEAEERIIEEMSSYISGEFDVADIKKAAYKEIFFTIDEKTEKEKRSSVSVFSSMVTNCSLLPSMRKQRKRSVPLSPIWFRLVLLMVQ